MAALGFMSQAIAAQQAVLVGPDLEPQSVTLDSFSAQGVAVTDRQGKRQTLPFSAVLRLTLNSTPQTIDANHITATLADGQVLVGSLLGPGEGGESIRLKLAATGREAELSLDDLLSLKLQGDAKPPAVEDDDALLLATGETLAGFVEAFGDTSISFIVGDGDDPIEVPLDRIHAVAIANKPDPAQAKAGAVLSRVALTDGSVFLLQGVALERTATRNGPRLTGQSSLSIQPKTLSVPLDSVLSIEPLSGQYTLSALSSFTSEVVAGGEVFGVPMPPTIEPDGAIALHAPTTLRYKLPGRAGRLVLSVALDLDADIPHNRRALAGCELVVYDGDQVVGGCVLEPDQPAQRLNLPLRSSELRLEIKPGVNGPVLDRVRLTDAELLLTLP